MKEPPSESSAEPLREMRYSASPQFVPLLAEIGTSLLVTTYQAGKLVAVGTHEGTLELSLHSFELAMGLAVHPQRIAVGTRGVFWELQPATEIAPRMAPAGKYDACLLARKAICTGNIHAHDLAYLGDELWAVNTLFSCLCTIDDRHSFIPRWKPKFISSCHEPGDRSHLNGMAVENGVPRYVTALAETDTPNGWRPEKHRTGVVIDIASGETIARGFAMPHSPRLHGGRLYVLDSGRGALCVVDPASGHSETITTFPGYTRGLGFFGPFAFVGLSRIRETSVFGGLPIAERHKELVCGVGIVDLRSGQQVAALRLESGVEELFAVEALPGIRCPALRGPRAGEDGQDTVWLVPPPAAPVPSRLLMPGR